MMMRIAAIALLGVLLTGCALEADKSRPELSFEEGRTAPLLVREIEIVPIPDYMQAKNPEGFIIDPAQSVYDFFKDRYRGEAVQGRFKLSITNASINHTVQKSDGAVRAYLNVDKHDTYEIQVKLRLETFGVGGYETQKVDVSARQTISISEHVSVAQRERTQIEAMRDLIKRLEMETEKAISQTFRI